MKSVKEITIEATYDLRKEVLRKNIDLPYKFSGDLQGDAFHLGAFKDAKLVGIVSFMNTTSDSSCKAEYQLRGMATLPEVRGEGFGSLLLTEGVYKLQQKGIEMLWCNARAVATGFYQKNGFEVVGESFDIAKVGLHYKMSKKLN